MLNHALRASAGRAYTSNVVFVGAGAGWDGSFSVPTHQVGDLIILHIVRLGTTSASITNPGGYTLVPGSSGLGSESSGSGIYGRNACYYKVATTTSEVTGAWTGATTVTAIVVRGHHPTTPFGGIVSNFAMASSTVNFSNITISAVKRANRLLGLASCRGTSLALDTPPTNMSNVFSGTVSAAHKAAVHTQKYAGVWPTTAVNYSGGPTAICAAVLEILSS